MRWMSAVLLVVGGCGRIGFSANAEAIDADPLAPDATRGDAMLRVCGNMICEAASDETCGTCADCATTAVVCGNGLCQGMETGTTCLYDCGPLPWPTMWETAAADLRTMINERRMSGGQCPMMGNLPGVGTLDGDPGLVRIARSHAWDFSAHDYLETDGRCAGPTIFDLMAAEGYTGARGAAFYYGGDGSATAVFDSWVNEPNLCPLMMNGVYTTIGVAFAHDDTGIPHWAALFY